MVEWIRLWTFKLENRVQSRWSYNFSLFLSPWKQSQYSFRNSIFFIREISFKFLVRTFLKKSRKICPRRHKKTALKSCSKSAQFFFSTYHNGPETQINCSIHNIFSKTSASFAFLKCPRQLAKELGAFN